MLEKYLNVIRKESRNVYVRKLNCLFKKYEDEIITIRLELGIFNDVPIEGYEYLVKTRILM